MVGRRFFLHMRSWVQVYCMRSRSSTMITILGIIKSRGKDERRRKEGKMEQRGREERIEARRDGTSYHISIWIRKRDNHKLEVV